MASKLLDMGSDHEGLRHRHATMKREIKRSPKKKDNEKERREMRIRGEKEKISIAAGIAGAAWQLASIFSHCTPPHRRIHISNRHFGNRKAEGRRLFLFVGYPPVC